jgi:hypothetical protein
MAFLSPLQGWLVSWFGDPRLTPWAVFFRRFAAGIDAGSTSSDTIQLGHRLSRDA